MARHWLYKPLASKYNAIIIIVFIFGVILIIMSTDLFIDIITIIMSTDKVDKWVPTSGDGKFPHTAV